MANTYLLSRKTNAGANDISYLALIKYTNQNRLETYQQIVLGFQPTTH